MGTCTPAHTLLGQQSESSLQKCKKDGGAVASHHGNFHGLAGHAPADVTDRQPSTRLARLLCFAASDTPLRTRKHRSISQTPVSHGRIYAQEWGPLFPKAH